MFGKSDEVSDACVPSIEQALAQADPTAVVTYYQGVDMTPACAWDSAGAGAAAAPTGSGAPVHCGAGNLTAAVAGVAGADVVVLALGNDEWQNGATAHENKDRVEIGLPGQQQPLADAVLQAAKAARVPVAAVLVNGGLCSLDSFAAPGSGVAAIIEALEPGNTGGTAVAEALFGDTNTFGKLPFTMYPRNFTRLSAMHDMSMSAYPGRTYKYYRGPAALFEYGFGLSYTQFQLAWGGAAASQGPAATPLAWPAGRRWVEAAVVVTNVGNVTGDEVVFLFHNSSAPRPTGAAASLGGLGGLGGGRAAAARAGTAAPTGQQQHQQHHQHHQHQHHQHHQQQPTKELVGFERVTLAPQQSVTVRFNVTARMLATTGADGIRAVRAGGHMLEFSRGHGDTVVVQVAVPHGFEI